MSHVYTYKTQIVPNCFHVSYVLTTILTQSIEILFLSLHLETGLILSGFFLFTRQLRGLQSITIQEGLSLYWFSFAFPFIQNYHKLFRTCCLQQSYLKIPSSVSQTMYLKLIFMTFNLTTWASMMVDQWVRISISQHPHAIQILFGQPH